VTRNTTTVSSSVVRPNVKAKPRTWPLVYLASQSTTLAKPAYNGLGAVQQVARERRAAADVKTGRG
ncbi:hypothetical protein, partial [Mycobacterium sp. E2327]|uniref:hypothetical protein n=1 Tax=Mycobacterium sp. E2327 TaxID=1834132 RepID=UPI001E3690BA